MTGPSSPRRPFTAEVQMQRVYGKPVDKAPAAAAAASAPVATAAGDPEILAAIRSLTAEVRDLRSQSLAGKVDFVRGEIQALATRIEQTKVEIANLAYPTTSSDGIVRSATQQLDAIVDATEQATNTILSCAEQIGNATSAITLALPEGSRHLASEIEVVVTQIFEACSFQDITGQRINKVVQTLRFIEDRIASMAALWGEEIRSVKPTASPGQPSGTDKDLLNGPQLNGQGVNQADIDALFS